MHELSITQSILEAALRRANGRRITDVYLAIGQLSSIVSDSVQSCWDVIAKGTLAEGARLHFRRIPAELQCMACFEKYPLNGEEWLCPKCGSVGARIVAGEEFRLETIDVE